PLINRISIKRKRTNGSAGEQTVLLQPEKGGEGQEWRPLKVGLVQINNSFSGQNYLPYAASLIEAYVKRHAQRPELYDFLLPVYKRDPVKQSVERFAGADVIGFSTYVWNIRISLEIARRIKEARPETLIVFGGPQVPDNAEAFLRENPAIDLVCHGEGEQVFLDILENYGSRAWNAVPGISYLLEDGSFVSHPRGARLKELNEIPSPFLEGTFEPLMAANPDEQWLALWETNRGCPFSCTFCDWGSATASKVYRFDMERLLKEIDWFADRKIEFIFCCDANFGILKRDVEIVQYAAETRQRTGYPHALSVQNTKNATERAYQVQKILSDAGLNKGVTLSLQSVDDHTLESIKRSNISSDTYQELQRRFTRDGVETYSDLILALPGETYRSFTEGVAHVIDDGQHNRIQFNNLAILPNAEMGDPEYQKQHGMETVQTHIINIHGALDDSENEITEYQDLVIATSSMPGEDWIRTRAFCWMAALLHFDKVFQVPSVLLREIAGIPYNELFELFSGGKLDAYPALSEVQQFFIDKARDLRNGGPEYVPSKEWLNIFWPADEYILIKLVKDGKLNAFYEEAEVLLNGYLNDRFLDFPRRLLQEAIELNKSLIKVPFQDEDRAVELSYNIWEYYRSILIGDPLPLEENECECLIDRTSETWDSWDDYCREVIWYGNKKGAYLYGNQVLHREFAGHF
ncbi:MAG: cobalamin-dependent protein, partial [Planctomycetota bacterium]|nr:cobalamin-dependent protein [Planctomycetota bacterium]